MRKGTKKIRQVNTGSGTYFAYDLDENAAGKVKRLYAKTEAELIKKIEAANEERKVELSFQKPVETKLEDYVKFYLKNAVGSIPSSTIRRVLQTFERAVFPLPINKEIETITRKEIEDFYRYIFEKYSIETLNEIHEFLGRTFELSNNLGVTKFDFSKVKLPDKQPSLRVAEYIMTPQELQTMLDYCIQDDCVRFGKGELLVTFMLMTGLRATQIQKIKYEDVAPDFRKVYVQNFDFPLSEQASEWLELHIKTDDPARNFSTEKGKTLFLNANGNPTALSSIQVTIDGITKRLGLPKGITGKSIQKAYIIKLIEEGVTPEEIKKRYNFKTQDPIKKMQDDYFVLRQLF